MDDFKKLVYGLTLVAFLLVLCTGLGGSLLGAGIMASFFVSQS